MALKCPEKDHSMIFFAAKIVIKLLLEVMKSDKV